MSNTKELKNYLINENDGYLLDDENNGKTIMLSGDWGSGKTYFWQNEIERKQKIIDNREKFTEEKYKQGLYYRLTQDKKKACVYVSLYGKDDLQALKNEVLFSAYNSVKDEDEGKALKNLGSVFGFGSRALSAISLFGVKIDTKTIGDETKFFFDRKKLKMSEEFLDGGIICFDDFERKSKTIDINDLFGFISQLSIESNCKTIIILNSDVFKGEEKNVFKTVKEKTVNKFFYHSPTIEELFETIFKYNGDKYKQFEKHEKIILEAIKKTEELNARIYIQVFDNCLEWVKKGHDVNALFALTLTTINFILNSFILNWTDIKPDRPGFNLKLDYNIINIFPKILQHLFRIDINLKKPDDIRNEFKDIKDSYFIQEIIDFVSKKGNQSKTFIYSEPTQNAIREWVKENHKLLQAVFKYGYKNYYMDTIDEETYKILANFVKTGILLPKENM